MVLTPLASRQSIETPLTYPPAAALEYYEKVLSYGPIAHFPIWDPFGSETAEELVNSPDQDGTHVNVTLGQDGIGDGRTSGWYNGATSFTNIFSPAFQAVFDGKEGTVMTWNMVNGGEVWTDGIFRSPIQLRTDGANRIDIAKPVAANQIRGLYVAGGVILQSIVACNLTTFFCTALTWSALVDEVRFYVNGIQPGPTLNGLGAWAGNLAIACIGASSTVPSNLWHGWEAHAAVFDYAIPPAGILDLATV